jgi:hypothetical protein
MSEIDMKPPRHNRLHVVAWFFGGAFLVNTIPHLVAGVSGSPFQTPFTAPALSSSPANVLWAIFNLVAAWLLLRVGELSLRRASHFAVAVTGVFVMALVLAIGLGRLHGGLL